MDADPDANNEWNHASQELKQMEQSQGVRQDNKTSTKDGGPAAQSTSPNVTNNTNSKPSVTGSKDVSKT